MKRTTAAGVLAWLLIAASAVFGAEPKLLRLSHINPQQPFDNSTGAMAAVFKSVVEAETGGSVKVVILSGGQMGNENEAMSQVAMGLVQSCISTAGGIAPFYPLYGVLDIPFAIPSYAVAWKVFDGPFGRWLMEDIRKTTGFRVLGFGEAGGFFQFSNNKRPIRTVGDMKGLKIRIMALPSHKSLLEAYGAFPAATDWDETYGVLQTGVADGQSNPIPIILAGKLYEVQKYLTITNHIYSTYCWIMDDRFYNSLDDHERSVVDSAAAVAIAAGRGVNRIIEATERGLPTLMARGMKVNTLTPEALAKFKEVGEASAMAFIKDNFGKRGLEMARLFLDAIREAEESQG